MISMPRAPSAATQVWVVVFCTHEWYIDATGSCRVIVSFRDEWLRAFFVEDTRSRHVPSDLESRLFSKLQMIDDAATDQDLRVPPSNHFEKLRGNLARLHSIRVNRWDSGRGEASEVYL